MVKNKNAVQVWLEFEEKNGREPTKEEFINMGYYNTYYYKIRKKINEIKVEELRAKVKKALSISEMV